MSKVKIIVAIIVALVLLTALGFARNIYNKRVEENKEKNVNKIEKIQNNNAIVEQKENNNVESLEDNKEKEMSKIIIEVNGKVLELETEDNKAVSELKEKLQDGSIVVEAEDYGDFEKVGSLGFSLTKDDKQIETDPGDVVLYQGNKISIFYASSAWEYTKLGKVTNVDKDELKEILGDGNVTLEIKIK